MTISLTFPKRESITLLLPNSKSKLARIAEKISQVQSKMHAAVITETESELHQLSDQK